MTQSKKTGSERRSKESSKTSSTNSVKIVIRRLPPALTSEAFLEQVSPLAEYNYYYFVSGESNEGAFSRAYIQFVHNDDILVFQDKFDGYIFLDDKGIEYPSIVEYAPFGKVPKPKVRPDPKAGSIESDPDYLEFLESLKKSEQEPTALPEAILEDIEAREKVSKTNHGCLKVTTPLIEFLTKRKEEKKQMKAKQKEDERRKRITVKEYGKPTKEKRDDVSDTFSRQTKRASECEDDYGSLKQSSKPSRGNTSKPFPKALEEDPKTKEKTSERDESRKAKIGYEYQKKIRNTEQFRKNKGKYGLPRENKDLTCSDAIDEKTTSNRENQQDMFSYKHSRPNTKKDIETETDSKNLKEENADDKTKRCSGCEVKDNLPSKIQSEGVKSKKEENYQYEKASDKQKIRYKDRPERAIYRPGQRKGKSNENGNN